MKKIKKKLKKGMVVWRKTERINLQMFCNLKISKKSNKNLNVEY